jgi:hypothetical protein
MKQKIKNQGVEEKKPIDPVLRNMQLYEKEVFPIRRMKSVRTSASYLKAVFGLCFKTKQLTNQRIIEVTRIA